MAETPVFNKTRLAPTPSGYLHVGNILSFAITAALAKKTGAKILLRIDDMDRERTNPLFVQDIFDTLHFMEIPWDEGPRNLTEFEKEYSGMHRLGIYRQALQQLRDQANIFACSCSRTQLLTNDHTTVCRDNRLSPDADNVSWRLYTPGICQLTVKTLTGIEKAILPETMKDFIVRKKDGFPAYQLTSVIDDLYFGVDLVIRGEDLWASTLAQLYLSSLLGKPQFENITFFHHPLVPDAGGGKLSKSAGATSVQYLRSQHKKPADIYALIAKMLNMDEPVRNWDDLCALLVPKTIGTNSPN